MSVDGGGSNKINYVILHISKNMISCEVSSCSKTGKHYDFEYTPCCCIPLCEEHYNELVSVRKCHDNCTNSEETCDTCFDINGYECQCESDVSE